jgi:hypothetical protein
VRRVRALWRSAVGGDSAGRVDEGGARGLAAQVEIVDGGAQFEECRALAAGELEKPRHLRRGHRLGARIVGHTAQHAQSGTGAVGVLTAATPTAPVSTSVTSESLSKIASSAVLLFVVIDIPQTPVGFYIDG